MRLSMFIGLLLFSMTLKAQEKQASNQHFWYSLETSASPDRIWEIWVDVPQWKEWDSGLKDAQLKGDFALGESGVITSLENRKSKFQIVEFEAGKSYTFKTKLPLGGLYVKRYLSQENGTTVFTHEVWFKGLTKGIFAKAFGEKFRAMLPQVLANIKTLAEDDRA